MAARRILNPQSLEDKLICEADFEAARRAIARNWPDLDKGNPKYEPYLRALAEIHKKGGADKFELRYNLRPPRDRTEEWARQFTQGEITEAQFGELLKADAERPIDLEMLTVFHQAYQARLSHFSEILQKAVIAPIESRHSATEMEKQIDQCVVALGEKLSIYRENLETVFDFLEELRVTSNSGILRLGKFEALSAHWLAQLMFTRISEAWQSCKEVSERSQHDRRYLYSATARELFSKTWLPNFPAPQSLSERLREEFILARVAIRGANMTAGVRKPFGKVEPEHDHMTSEQAIDNECRADILVGELTTLVAKAGHIFRPQVKGDWGIDGEIEFKDGKGQATARRVYVQLKSGDSYLRKRIRDGVEIFAVKKPRHLAYWAAHTHPVMLVIRLSSGHIRWMDVRAYLKQHGCTDRNIIFAGDDVTVQSIQQLATDVAIQQEATDE